MTQAHLLNRVSVPDLPEKKAFPYVLRPARVKEADMAFAIAAWFGGNPWSLPFGEWFAPQRRSVRLLDLGDALACDGVVIATRNPSAVIAAAPWSSRAHLSEARAVASVALRGDHLKLYRPRA